MFHGFTQGSVDFLWGIRFNNERSWFLAHKQEYLDLLAGPMGELARETRETMAERRPELTLDLHLSRIYRDARRLHGRGPYKDHLWFSLHPPRDAQSGQPVPCFYFELAPEYHGMGMGFHSATPATMAKFRARIDRDPAPLEKLARNLEKQDRFVLDGESYVRPKGDPGPLLAPWYNRKWISIRWERNCEGSLFTPALAGEIAEGFSFLVPYYQYFASLAGEADPL